MINFHEFESGLLFLYLDVIPGFQLYRLEHYPYAVRTEGESLVIAPHWHFDERPMDQRLYHELSEMISRGQLPPVGTQQGLASAAPA